jgi:hypothetical protein
MDGTMIVALLFLGGFVAWIMLSNQAATGVRTRFEKALAESQFPYSDVVLGADANTGVAIAKDESALILVRRTAGSGEFTQRTVPIAAVLSCELHEDGDTVTSTSRGSQLGGAIVGDLLFGKAGAMIGGLSGKKSNTAMCRVIELRLTVDDTSKPLHGVLFQNSETPRKDPGYIANSQRAREWAGKIAVLIKRQEKAAIESAPTAAHLVGPALLQLVQLRDAGVLTSDEFEVQKSGYSVALRLQCLSSQRGVSKPQQSRHLTRSCQLQTRRQPSPWRCDWLDCVPKGTQRQSQVLVSIDWI